MNEIIWKEHLLKKEPKKAFYVTVFLIILTILISIIFKSILLGIICLLVLFISIVKFFFPTEYKLQENLVEINFLGFSKRHKWQEFKGVHLCETGVLLSPFPQPHRLDTFRGVYLLCKDNKMEVYEYAKQKIQR